MPNAVDGPPRLPTSPSLIGAAAVLHPLLSTELFVGTQESIIVEAAPQETGRRGISQRIRASISPPVTEGTPALSAEEDAKTITAAFGQHTRK